jgi:cell division protein FtsW
VKTLTRIRNQNQNYARQHSRIRAHRPDTGLILLVGILLVIGVVVIYSISPTLSRELLGEGSENYFAYSQLGHIGLGIFVFAVATKIPLTWWRKLLPWLVLATLASFLLMLTPLGVTSGGATRWLGTSSLSFQPVELAKFTLVIGAAAWFSGLKDGEIKRFSFGLVPLLIALGVLSAFVVLHQSDLGSMLVLAAIAAAIFFVAGAPLRHIGYLLGIGLAGIILSIVLAPHRMERLRTFFNPEQGIAETGYHLHQALIAVGSGGLFGLGLGESVQVYGYLPEAANDSIFAIIGETFGLLGGLVIVALFVLLLQRCLVIARSAHDRFAGYMALGIGTWIGVQALINITAMIGMIPLSGITLPLVSYGGSSLLFVMLAMGVVTHISMYTVRNRNENRTHRGRNGRAHRPAFGGSPGAV